MAGPLFLSLDGLDGTGKSTQCRLLTDWLRTQGCGVTTCADPGGTVLGEQLRSILLHQRSEIAPWSEALLFMASRAQLVAEVIRPALARGESVVCDRFLLATVVYQGHGRGLPVDDLWRIGRVATGGLEPDLTLVLDLPLEVARQRRHRPADRIESRDAAYQDRVREGFLLEARRQPERRVVVRADQSIDAVQEEIRRLVAERLAGGATG
jgi:dTMP kinase